MIERVTWQEFTARFRWKQGEHLTLIAPSGAGKTTVERALLGYRGYNVFFGTKPADVLYEQIIRSGFVRVESLRDIRSFDRNVMLWPRYTGSIDETMEKQRIAFKEALDIIVKQGAWAVWLDESKYLAEQLGLSKSIKFCVNQLRSNKSSIICGAQRPAWVPPDVLSNASHIFLWKTTKRGDLLTLSDIGGIDAQMVKDTLKTLGNHEFLYIYTRGVNSRMVISQVRN